VTVNLIRPDNVRSLSVCPISFCLFSTIINMSFVRHL
jgi:hypothetical protein